MDYAILLNDQALCIEALYQVKNLNSKKHLAGNQLHNILAFSAACASHVCFGTNSRTSQNSGVKGCKKDILH